MIGNDSEEFVHLDMLAYINTKFICVVMNASESIKSRSAGRLNMLHVVLRNDGGLDLLVWSKDLFKLNRLHTPTALVSSLEWFCNRVERRHLKHIQVIAQNFMNSIEFQPDIPFLSNGGFC